MNGKNGHDRLPPHSDEAEQGILGCCMLSPETLDLAKEQVRTEMFYDLRHAMIWSQLMRLGSSDLIVLQQALRDTGDLDKIGGVAFLTSLPDKVPSAGNWSYYAEILREKWLLRRRLKLCAETTAEIYEREDRPQEVLAKSEAGFLEAMNEREPAKEKTMGQIMEGVRVNLFEKYRRGVKIMKGPATGFNYLDNILMGFAPGTLNVLAARPSTGKSALMMQIAENIARTDKSVGIFSLEMTAEELGARENFQRAESDLTKFRNGFLTDTDIERLAKANAELAHVKIYVDDTEDMFIEDMEAKASRMIRQHDIKLFCVDYFQLMGLRRQDRGMNTNEIFTRILKGLRSCAKRLRVPFLVLSQMNREIDKETHRRPRLSDLRDSGQIEQDAHVVMFLWKPETSYEDESPGQRRIKEMISRVPCPDHWKTWERNEEGKNWRNYLTVVTCTVEKQREGRSHEDAALVFIKPWTRFVDAYRPAKDKPTRVEDGGSRMETEEMV